MNYLDEMADFLDEISKLSLCFNCTSKWTSLDNPVSQYCMKNWFSSVTTKCSTSLSV